MTENSSRDADEMNSIETFLEEDRIYSASDSFKSQANFNDQSIYQMATEDRLSFWEDRAKELDWIRPWDDVLKWDRPYAKWFEGGQLNASINCLDVHLDGPREDKIALIWESENGSVQNITYRQLHEKVCQLSNVLKHNLLVQKGDRVTIYLPLIPEAVVAMLACARIGAIHSVVFGGFSSQSLRDRLIDSGSKVLIIADGGFRRGKVVPLKSIANDAISSQDTPLEKMLVIKHTNQSVEPSNVVEEFDYHTLMEQASSDYVPAIMDSEDPLFILYTSGTTGKPKGILHTTGGYLTHAKYSTRAVFDTKDTDIYWCTADVGWITGHSYLVYGPLSNGVTCFMYEGTPDYPDKNRFWELVDKHGVSILYTAPTAIRCFMKWGEEYVNRHDLSSLRLLGSVGEPINPEAWVWYYEKIGGGNCPIVDTWWQTETGGIMISNLPALNDMKPGHAGLPLPGITASILDQSGSRIESDGGLLSLMEPWPSMLRGVWGDPQRFKDVYWGTFDTYFAGDGAKCDEDGYYMVMGRVDDVLNCAGHRIGTMEVESALVACDGVAEAAVVGIPDEIKGQAIAAFVILEDNQVENNDTKNFLSNLVASTIGAIAKPKLIIFTSDLPKTRSGKIMRRVLKALVEKREVGDTTTLANPDIVQEIQSKLN